MTHLNTYTFFILFRALYLFILCSILHLLIIFCHVLWGQQQKPHSFFFPTSLLTLLALWLTNVHGMGTDPSLLPWTLHPYSNKGQTLIKRFSLREPIWKRLVVKALPLIT